MEKDRSGKVIAIVGLIIGVVLSLISIFFMIRSMRLLNLSGKKKTPYQKYVNKILREYDRLIVETETKPGNKKNIVKVNRFEELLDVRDNLKLPIKYYKVSDNECFFYIDHEDEIYLNNINTDIFDEKREK